MQNQRGGPDGSSVLPHAREFHPHLSPVPVEYPLPKRLFDFLDVDPSAWIEEKEWWYRATFDGPEDHPSSDERLRLVFHGLDAFATIYLNGEELGKHHNMFREAAFDVSDLVSPGLNTLALLFDRPLDHVGEEFPGQWGRNPERVYMRKAQFGFGWDWGPRLPTVGIWRPVELRRASIEASQSDGADA